MSIPPVLASLKLKRARVLDKTIFRAYSKGMDGATKARLFEEGGKIASDLLRAAISRPPKRPMEAEEKPVKSSTPAATPQHPGIALPTSEETTEELKRRLGRELYRAELDLAAGLKIAGKPCDCLSNKHPLMLEAASEELISQDPGNSVYQDIIQWIKDNQDRVTVEAIHSGKYAAEYPHMANEFKNFRKRVFGSAGTAEPAGGKITLEEAKKMAAEEAAKEVERAWKLEG